MNAGSIALALVFAVALWWASTGAVLWLSRRARGRRSAVMGGATLAAGLAVAALAATRDATSPAAACAAFTAALVLWGWQELAFLTGLVTGPSSAPCPADARGWSRFRAAAATLIHHELALALTTLVVAALTLGAANPIGGWTVLVLFAARLSSKLNLFLGAPNFSVELFPAELRHLASYLRRGPVSALYPVSLAALALAAAAAAATALDASAPAFAAVGYALVFALLTLAALEHVFMAAPLPDAALWRWALPASEHPAPLAAPLVADAAKGLN